MVLLWYYEVRKTTGNYHDEMSAVHFEEGSKIVLFREDSDITG